MNKKRERNNSSPDDKQDVHKESRQTQMPCLLFYRCTMIGKHKILRRTGGQEDRRSAAKALTETEGLAKLRSLKMAVPGKHGDHAEKMVQ